MNKLTQEQLIADTHGAYLDFIHLGDYVDDAIALVAASEPLVSDQLIHDLIVANYGSWRERLLGLVLACMRGVTPFIGSMFGSLRSIRGISIVPTFAVLAVAIRHFGFKYDPKQTDALDRKQFDGEVGYAIDCLHNYIGLSEGEIEGAGPNYGQLFVEHVAFYRRLCGV